MKKTFGIGILVITIITIIFIAGCISTGPEPIPITYYYSENCTDCSKMDSVFNNLTNSYRGQFTLAKYDIKKEPVKFYNDQVTHNGDGTVPFVFVSNLTLNGYQEYSYNVLEYYIVHRDQFVNVSMENNIINKRAYG